MNSDRVLLNRLAEYGIDAKSWDDPWCSGFHPRDIVAGDSLIPEYYDYRGTRSAEWHAARIRFIAQSKVDLVSPITIDCMCNAGSILAIPVIVDGWHRLHAHWFLRRKSIPATFGGRLDLWDYLRGASSIVPE
jgi:hypothetical protein